MEFTSGMYLNFYDGTTNVYLILNEGNDEPTSEEAEVLQEMVKEILDGFKGKGCSHKELEAAISNAMEDCSCNCVSFGGIAIVVQ